MSDAKPYTEKEAIADDGYDPYMSCLDLDRVLATVAALAQVTRERDDIMGVTEKFKHERDEARAAHAVMAEAMHKMESQRNEARAELARVTENQRRQWEEKDHYRQRAIDAEGKLLAKDAEVAMLKQECASVSEEFGLPPTIRPAEGEIRRMVNALKGTSAEVERLRQDRHARDMRVAEAVREACAASVSMFPTRDIIHRRAEDVVRSLDLAAVLEGVE